MATLATLREELLSTARYIKQKGLTPGHTGNVSLRLRARGTSKRAGEGKAEGKDEGKAEEQEFKMLITPTGIPYESMLPRDLVVVSSDGTWSEKGLAPSSEWQFHLAALKANRQVNALVHTHSNYAVALASAGKPIPAFHYMVAAAGGMEIPLVPYAIFGSSELSRLVGKAFATHKACLMAHHGQLAGGKSLREAVELAEIVEDLAQQYWAVCQLGKPKLLTKAQMKEVLEKFKTYGQQRK